MRQLRDFRFVDSCPAIYPWASLADGAVYELTMGADFRGTLMAARQSAKFWARRNGFTVRTARRSKKLIVRFESATKPTKPVKPARKSQPTRMAAELDAILETEELEELEAVEEARLKYETACRRLAERNGESPQSVE